MAKVVTRIAIKGGSVKLTAAARAATCAGRLLYP